MHVSRCSSCVAGHSCSHGCSRSTSSMLSASAAAAGGQAAAELMATWGPMVARPASMPAAAAVPTGRSLPAWLCRPARRSSASDDSMLLASLGEKLPTKPGTAAAAPGAIGPSAAAAGTCGPSTRGSGGGAANAVGSWGAGLPNVAEAGLLDGMLQSTLAARPARVCQETWAAWLMRCIGGTACASRQGQGSRVLQGCCTLKVCPAAALTLEAWEAEAEQRNKACRRRRRRQRRKLRLVCALCLSAAAQSSQRLMQAGGRYASCLRLCCGAKRAAAVQSGQHMRRWHWRVLLHGCWRC